MAPILSEATAAVIVLATVLLSPELATADRRYSTSSTSTSSSSSRKAHGRQRHQPPMADRVIAWGQRRRTDYSNRIQADTSMVSRDDDLGDPGVAVADGSWTHSAFRAFHELRAGLPPSLPHGDGAEEGEEGGKEGSEDSFGAGPLGGLRRLASGMPRSLGQALGRKPPDDTDVQLALPAARNGKRPVAGASSTTTALVAATKATTTTTTTTATTATSTTGATAVATNSTSPPACWHMRGRLTNTATGQTIALVEGVELVRSLAFETAQEKRGRMKTHKQKEGNEAHNGSNTAEGKGGRGEVALTEGGAAEGGQGGGGELEVDRALKPGVWTAFGALATNKFFMYQDPDTGEPMEYYRNTPVEKKQMVRTYERFSQVVSHLLQPNGRVLVVSEWGGRSVKAETANNNGVEELDGGGNGFGFGKSKGGLSSSFSSSSSAPRRVFNLHFFVEARTPKEERALKRWEDRPAAKWIAFGATPPRAHGCKEIYSYVTGGGGGGGGGGASRGGGAGQREQQGRERKWSRRGGNGEAVAATAGAGKGAGSRGLMSYTRYGECPTWYGTGRMCGLDVQARRVDSFRSLPAKLRAKVLEIDPDFESGPPGTLEECRSIAKREREEREEGRRKRSLRNPFGSWGSSGK